MKRYEAYKDSGIEWIGEIPKNWEITKLKYLGNAFGGLTYSPNNVVTSEKDGVLVLRSSNIQDGKLSLIDNVYVNSKIPKKIILQKGDILICSRNGSQRLIGKNICIDERMEGNTFGAFMMVFRSSYWVFLKYFFNSPIFASQSSLFLTATINQLTSNTINNFWIAIPKSLEEQQAIASCLERKTSEIDSLIEKKKQLISLLQEERIAIINHAVTKGIDTNVKLKDSGIEWIGEIPKHWWIVPVRRLIDVRDGTHETPPFINSKEGIPLITSKDFKNGEIVFNNAKLISIEDHLDISKRSGVTKGDVLMSMIGGNIGKSVLVGDNDQFSIKNVALFRTHSSLSIAKFLRYYFESTLLDRQIEFKSRGGAQGFLSLGDIRNLFFFKMPENELESIVIFLDKKTSEIDIIITKTKKEIELLEEYKTTLISEVVTGKVDVREEVVN